MTNEMIFGFIIVLVLLYTMYYYSDTSAVEGITSKTVNIYHNIYSFVGTTLIKTSSLTMIQNNKPILYMFYRNAKLPENSYIIQGLPGLFQVILPKETDNNPYYLTQIRMNLITYRIPFTNSGAYN